MGQKETDLIRQAADYENQENLKKAFKCYEKAAKTGDGEILYLCSAKCMKMPFGNAQKKALDWCRESAMLDYADAQLTLARIYADGAFGTQKNPPRAEFWALQAKNHGSKEGDELYFKMMATMPFKKTGPGVLDVEYDSQLWKPLYQAADEDRKALREARRKSAVQGDPTIQYLYGMMVAEDNKKEALSWYERSAQSGYTRAKYKCGTTYQDGDGIPKDLSKAFYWYGEAAKDGHGNAQFQLAKMYDEGNGVQKNREQALYWCKKAAEQQVSGAQTKYDSLMREDDPDMQANLASRKILVCDNAVFMRRMVATTLNKAGFPSVREAVSPKELIHEYQSLKPDLVFFAIKSDYYDEVEATLKEISTRWPDARIILTCNDTFASVAQTLKQEYSVVAGKLMLPFNIDTLSGIALKNLGIK